VGGVAASVRYGAPIAISAVSELVGTAYAWSGYQMGRALEAVSNLVQKGFGREATKISLDENKIDHIFGQSKHGLEGLVKQFGSQEAGYQAMQQATEAAVRRRVSQVHLRRW